jgi:hypothetical protein
MCTVTGTAAGDDLGTPSNQQDSIPPNLVKYPSCAKRKLDEGSCTYGRVMDPGGRSFSLAEQVMVIAAKVKRFRRAPFEELYIFVYYDIHITQYF